MNLLGQLIMASNILLLHAMGECYTTSASLKVGKIRFLQTLKKNQELSNTIEMFALRSHSKF